MAVSTINCPVLTVSNTQSTGSINAGSGASISIPISVPQGKKVVMVMCEERTGANLFPIWLQDYGNTYVNVRVYNARTSAYTATLRVTALCI